jgi:hypothetical protein
MLSVSCIILPRLVGLTHAFLSFQFAIQFNVLLGDAVGGSARESVLGPEPDFRSLIFCVQKSLKI